MKPRLQSPPTAVCPGAVQHQAELAAKCQRAVDEQAGRHLAERARTGADITLNDRDFATDMYEIRENGHFHSRRRREHQADRAAAARRRRRTR